MGLEILLRDGIFTLRRYLFCLITQSIVNLLIVGSFVILTFRKSIETIAEGFGFFRPTSKRSQESDTG